MAHGYRGKVEWYEPAYRWDVESRLAEFNKSIQDEKDIHAKVLAGQIAFADMNPRPIPEFLRFGSYYILPEGLRENGLGVPLAPEKTGLVTPSLGDAVRQWNDHHLASLDGKLPWRTDAEWILSMTPSNIAELRYSTDSLSRVKTQPIREQLSADVQIVRTFVPALCIPAALVTNLGWLLWWTVRFFRRLARRERYGSNRLAT